MPLRVPPRIAVLAAFAGLLLPATVLTQQPEQTGASLALDLLDRLQYTRAGAESITASMSLVEFEARYCLPPDQPTKAKEEQFLKAREATLQEYRQRYRTLRIQLLNEIHKNGRALAAVQSRFPNGNPEDDSFWQPWLSAFKRAQDAIQAKRNELKNIPEVRCRPLPEPGPGVAPPPTPQGPGIDLPAVKLRPVEIPPIPAQFCSEEEKRETLNRFYAVENDFYMNYQDAREYYDAITDAIAKGRGNLNVLRSLLPAARQNLDQQARRDDEFHQALARVRAMPVTGCGNRPQAAPEPIQLPDYEPFVFPRVPERFCSQSEKDETVTQLRYARDAARRNYDKAAAAIVALGDRIAKGDKSTALSDAFNKVNADASAWLKQSRELDTALQQAEAMPVSSCQPESRSSVSSETGSRFRAGLTLAMTYFPKFEDQVGDQPGITGHSASKSPVYFGALAEYDLSHRVRVSAGAVYGRHEFRQVYAGGAVTGKVKSFFFDSRVSYALPFGRLRFLPGVGFTWAHDQLDDWQVEDGPALLGHSHDGLLGNLGFGLELPLGSGFGARLGSNLITSFKKNDADTHWRFGLTVTRDFRL